METTSLPERATMLRAFLDRDSTFDGVFFTGVHTTGIFCRPTCTARKPLPKNVDFYSSANAALQAGFRPCKRCRPLELRGTPPSWLRALLNDVEADPSRRWTDEDLRTRGLSPDRVRRWFQTNHGMTFHAYSRSRRLGSALGQIRQGDNVSRAAFSTGYDSLSGFQDAFRQLLDTTPGAARESTVVTVNRVPTPLGPMLAGATEDAICLLEFTDRRMIETQLKRLRQRLDCVFVPGESPLLEEMTAELEAYFEGRLEEFNTPVEAPGTEFQVAVWDALQRIPYGATASYSEIAAAIGRPTAIRAVARSNGDNRIAIVIPCHRVIGSDGTLTGYGGGLWRKKRLLELETRQLAALI